MTTVREKHFDEWKERTVETSERDVYFIVREGMPYAVHMELRFDVEDFPEKSDLILKSIKERSYIELIIDENLGLGVP